ncbi:InlB B-repeat-containing protein [Lysinibacillus boronitolerans]|uniref:InlB B-repeat-containing protein n=1 Tax=Lysinibacillus boronitolerans TaxID=309788 RepID=UPI003852F6AC
MRQRYKKIVSILLIFLLFFQWIPSAFADFTLATPPSVSYKAVAYGDGKYVATSLGTNTTVYYSTNGSTWTQSTTITSSQTINSVVYENNQFIAVDNLSNFYTSSDGQTWTTAISVDGRNPLHSVTYGYNKYVTVGGNIHVSSDGIEWKKIPQINQLYGVIYANNQFVAVGADGTILTSSDGENWSRQTSNTKNILRSVIYANGQYVVVGQSGTILTSPDGIIWTKRDNLPSSVTTILLTSVSYGNGHYVTVGFSGKAYYSADGINWTEQATGLSSGLQGVTYGNGQFVIVGANGAILYGNLDVPTQVPRVITLTPATSITSTSARVGGEITFDGGAEITERGIVYSTSAEPTTENSEKVTAIGTTGAFSVDLSGLNPSSTYYYRAYAKNSVGTSYGENEMFETLTVLPELGGTVSITGEAKYDGVLTADISSITYTPTTTADVPTYQWYRGNTVIPGATSSTYMLVEADIGEKLKVTVTADGTNATGSVTSGVTAIVEKADGPSAPSAPTEASKTTTSITLHGVAGQEYSRDNGTTWQDSPIFSGLTPDTEYMFITRVRETATHKASLVSAGAPIQTQPIAIPVIGGTVSIAGETKYGNVLTSDISGITYTPITASDVPTYQWYRGNTVIPGATSSTYTLVEADIGEKLKVTVSADGTHATGSVTSGATATVEKANGPSAPSAPTEASKTTTSITLHGVAGQEYSKDNGTTWQDSPIFSELTPNTGYMFITRVRETATHKASLVSAGAPIQTQPVAIPVIGGTVSIAGETKYGNVLTSDISGITYTPITASDVPTYQWYRGNTVIPGATSSTYTLVEADIGEKLRVTVTADGTNATGSITSGETAFVEKADGPSAPPAPTEASKTATSITLNGVVGQEYSKDNGATWQDSLIFNGLIPETEYTFITRVKETPTHKASLVSTGTSIQTQTQTVAVPEMGGTISITGETKYGSVLTADISGITYTPPTTADALTYEWYRGNTAISGANSSTYMLVQADIGETIKVRASADGTNATGSVMSGETTIVEKADGPSAPPAPTVASKTATNITLNGVVGQEYSRDNGTTWQDSPIFGELTPDTEYTFITRVKETATHKASLVSAGTLENTSVISTFTITYNGNTNTGGTVPTDSETYEQGETVTVLGNTGNLVKVGYIFEGWNTQADGRGIDYAPASTFLMGSGSIILYAKWKPVIVTYTISFDVAGGSPVSNQTVVHEGKASQPTPAPTKAGHIFEGWYTSPAYTTPYDYNSAITRHTTIYAKWIPITYTVRFDVNGGSAVSNQTVEHGKKASQPAQEPTKAGYTFGGWYISNAYTTPYDFNSAINENTTIYAKWIPGMYTVRFDVDGGSAISDQTVEYGKKASQPKIEPTKAGYTFVGWYTNNAYTTPFNFDTAITANTVIYAKWISNDTGGGNTDPSPNPDAGSTTPSTNVEEIVVDVESGDGDLVSKTTVKRTKNTDNTIRDEVLLTPESATETIRKLKEQGNDKARIIIPDQQDQVNQVHVSVPRNVVTLLQNSAVHLEIVTDNVRIEVPKTSLETFNDNLYFRLVPIKERANQLDIKEQAKKERAVQQLAGSTVVELLGRPMTIETNMQSRPVILTLPLPTDLTREQLNHLAIYIEHSDGTKEVVRGKVVEYQKGITGLQFEVNKFSTFSILYLPEKEEVKEPTTDGVTHLPYIQGYPDGTFRPNAPVTRAQMASMFARQLTGNAIPQAKATYTDTFQHDAKDAIEFAKEKGLFKGVTATNFNPNGLITRAQMATVAARWIEQQCVERPDADFCQPTSPSAAFKDVSFNHWAVKAIDTVNAAEIMTGVTADTFNPDGFLTRAQAVKVLNRLFERQVLTEVQTPLFTDVLRQHWAFYEIQEAAKK